MTEGQVIDKFAIFREKYKVMQKILLISTLVCAALCCGCQTKNDAKQGEDEQWKWDKDKTEEKKDEPKKGDPYYPKEAGVTRLMTYNVGVFWKSKDQPGGLADSSDMIAEMIKEVEADICAIQELDSCNTRHNKYQLSVFAGKLGWNFWYSRAMPYKEGSYGIGVVLPKESRILDKYTVALPQEGESGEPRAISVVETEKYVFASTHMHGSSARQIAVVNSWVQSKYANYDKPVFLAGDMNTTKDQEAFQLYLNSWEVISAGENSAGGVNPATRCIDWIFHYKKSKSVTVKGSHTMTKFYNGDVTKASDHLPVYVDVLL